MKFAGLVKNSFVDYPNEISAVVFTLGCNFNCWYCHNSELIKGSNKSIELISEEEVLKFLNERKGFLDGLVISGGEPTLQPDLKKFIMKVKKLGYKVKLDTNGTNPTLLKDLIDQKLIDFVSMDIKDSLDKYDKIIRLKTDIKSIKKSIEVLINSDIDYEFRTTFSPDISILDIEEISKTILGAKSYVLQKYNPVENGEKVVIMPHNFEDFKIANELANKYVKCSLRSFD